MSKQVDEHAAHDLYLFVENDGRLHEREFLPIVKNLMKKRTAGKYDHGRAIDAFVYLADSGAKKYAREVSGGSPAWNITFGPATRRETARKLARVFEQRASAGDYDHLIPGAGAGTGAGPSRASGKTPAQLDREIQAAIKANKRRR